MLEMSQPSFHQALGAADIKTGLLERICDALGKDMSFFYPECGRKKTEINIDDSNNSSTTHGDNSPALSGGSTLTQNNDQTELVTALNSRIASLERQLTIKDKQIELLINNK